MRATNGLGERVRRARERLGLSQSALARAAKLRPQTVHAIEAGLILRPRALTDLACALSVRSEWLLWGEPPIRLEGVSETAPAYDPRGPLSPEALEIGQQWMDLAPAHRALVRSLIEALRAV